MTEPRLVLDTNCLIDLEQGRHDAPFLRRLIQSHRQGHIALAVAAVSAAENQPGGTISRDIKDFESMLRRLDLSDVKHLLPLATWDVGYWDRMLWSSDALDAQLQAIWIALFPAATADALTPNVENKKWRNQYCDAMMAWCSIHHGWTQLVTRDENFHKRRAVLKSLGLHTILYPSEAAQLYAP